MQMKFSFQDISEQGVLKKEQKLLFVCPSSVWRVAAEQIVKKGISKRMNSFLEKL